MSDTLQKASHTEMIGHAVGFAEAGKGRFLKTFGAVGDDKLNYTPATSAKTPIQIGAHIAVSNNGYARMIEGSDEKIPELAIAIKMMQRAEAKIDTGEKVVAAIEESHARLMTAINGLTAETFESTVSSPFGETAIAELIFYPGTHYHSHASQVDYVQTCYGDQEFHM